MQGDAKDEETRVNKTRKVENLKNCLNRLNEVNLLSSRLLQFCTSQTA